MLGALLTRPLYRGRAFARKTGPSSVLRNGGGDEACAQMFVNIHWELLWQGHPWKPGITRSKVMLTSSPAVGVLMTLFSQTASGYGSCPPELLLIHAQQGRP